MITKPAIAVEKSNNAKTGPVSATYVSQGSCPTTCSFLGAGCYAELGRTGMHTRNLADADTEFTPVQLARRESAAIRELSGMRPLRLHVVGDCRTNESAKIVSRAADRYRGKHGQPVWTYTHAWRTVERVNWGDVAVRASVESERDIAIARERGYPAALVVDHHPENGASWKTKDGTKVIPCPEQTRGTTCSDCRLCWTSPHVIAFAAHGARAETVRKAIA
jgi:hypothetical protein